MGQEVVAEKGTVWDSIINANILVGGTSRKAAVVLRKIYVLLAVSTVPLRSSRFPYVSQLSEGFLRKNFREHARKVTVVPQRTAA